MVHLDHQQLAYLEQVPLYGLFLDLRKAFDAMDRERCLLILEDRGVGPRIRLLIERFWALALLVCKAGGYFGTAVKALRGVTQGGPLSPRIFNLMVDAVIREWLRQVLGNRVAADGIGTQIRLLLAAFYADNGLVQSRDPEFLQFSFDILVGLFERVGLRTNTTKTEAHVFKKANHYVEGELEEFWVPGLDQSVVGVEGCQ